MARNLKWDDFKVSKEYKLWGNLKEVCDTLGLRDENEFLKVEDCNEYWEPLLERIYKMGVFFKQTSKLKEIKIDWVRPIFYVGTEYTVKIDGKEYEPPKEAMYNAQEVHRCFRYLIGIIQEHEKLDPATFKKMRPQMQKTFGDFFKALNTFVNKIGFRFLHENIKEILKPFRELRRSCYRLFLLEAKERQDDEITFLARKGKIKIMSDSVKIHFQNEEYKMKRDVPDMEKFEQDFLYKNMGKGAYEYVYPTKMEPENLLGLPNKFQKDALQLKFEQGFELMLKYLYDKQRNDFLFPIDVHKLFRNLEIPKANELHPIKFYIDQQKAYVRELKVRLYEMKINGLSRIQMPITKNVELIQMIKRVYDLHNIIENIMGDKLKYDQYVFIYNCIKLIYDSTARDELTMIKNRGFMEDAIPKYIILMAMKQAAEMMEKMRLKSKSKGDYFNWDDYFQMNKMQLDHEDSLLINTFELTEPMRKVLNTNPELKKTIDIFENEMHEFGGRFWILEGFFPIEDRKLWLEGIDVLRNINTLVIDDIRDYILLNYEGNLGKNKETTNIKDPDRRQSKMGLNDSSQGLVHVGRHMVKRDSKKDKMPIVGGGGDNTRQRGSSSKGRKGNQKFNPKQPIQTEKSIESDDESMIVHRNKIPIKLDGLRPPYVWNFPVQKLQQQMIKKKGNEDIRIEIRNVDPTKFYKDGRVKTILDIIGKVKQSMLDYCMEKKADLWKYYFEKVIHIWSIQYLHSDRRSNMNKTGGNMVSDNNISI